MPEEQVAYECISLEGVVRRLADGLARELAGLNIDEPLLALKHAEDLLGNELMIVRLALAVHERQVFGGEL